ncbi:MAG: TatD family nuclease-associated radical SAM protein [Oscillospiraceae bacterium]|nr:TatD family nuclease-associated radical SAM protein [Oscillospiraceae bacterium]
MGRTFHYELGDALYLNITNTCPCDCVFCIRRSSDSVALSGGLWLDGDPSPEEVSEALDKLSLRPYSEVVFCGFGEPTSNLGTLLGVCRYLRARGGPGDGAPPIRLNTNGLSDLINGSETAPKLAGLVDRVSISLNAPNAGRYCELTRPAFGPRSFDAVLRFAKSCVAHIPVVAFTVMDCLTKAEISECAALAAKVGVTLRVRETVARQG